MTRDNWEGQTKIRGKQAFLDANLSAIDLSISKHTIQIKIYQWTMKFGYFSILFRGMYRMHDNSSSLEKHEIWSLIFSVLHQ